ncbi:MAG: glycosyltransferase family 2 protein [Sedimentisphaerales bacterium]
MTFLYTVAIICVLMQILLLVQVRRNCKYFLNKAERDRTAYRPKVALIVPCKGIDTAFEKNIGSFYEIDYGDYELIFVVENAEDAAYNRLAEIKGKFAGRTKAFDVRILVAGVAAQGSQKLHNLLYAFANISNGVEVLAFADSDACVKNNWLSHILYPLRKDKYGVSSGYRWYVPVKNNLATLALASMNAKIAQLLGPTIFNKAWGGAMAVRVDVFKKLGIDKIWRTAASDDLTISRAVKKAGMIVAFVPACLSASYERTNWKGLFEFARRQFIITRITMPGTWAFGLFGNVYSVFGLWGFAAISAAVYFKGTGRWELFAAAAAFFFVGQLARAIMRQRAIFKLLPDDAEKMKIAAFADIVGGPIWSLVLLACIISSAFTRTIQWRGVKYKLISPTETVRV